MSLSDVWMDLLSVAELMKAPLDVNPISKRAGRIEIQYFMYWNENSELQLNNYELHIITLYKMK